MHVRPEITARLDKVLGETYARAKKRGAPVWVYFTYEIQPLLLQGGVTDKELVAAWRWYYDGWRDCETNEELKT